MLVFYATRLTSLQHHYCT